ncbi:MAG: mechanosensitive ion channel family protein [Lysobacterales bacterium]|nr:MAG: mechanosensitive ion channel family protein [Xanthomonadales bacterium]
MFTVDGISWTRIVGILAAGALAGLVVRASLRQFQRLRIEGEADLDAERRALTLTGALRHALGLIIGFIVGLLLLSEIGVDIVPLLGAAGVVGVAVGLAAQGVARDFIRGLALLADDQIRIGDDVVIAGHRGVVEDVALRCIRLREYDGTVHFVPTGQIDTVTNRSFGTVYAVVDVAVDAAADLERARAALRAAGEALTQDPAFSAQVTGSLDIAGLERWEGDAAVIRARLPVVPKAQAALRRELLERAKTAFEAAEIAAPTRRLLLTRESPTAD